MSTRYRSSCDECGWQQPRASKTRGLSDLAYRLHSCDKQCAHQAATARRREREAAVDRTPKPCIHPIARHEHGTYTAYTHDWCRCLPCARAISEYENNRQRQHAYGRWTHWVDPEPARAHVRALGDQGMGLKRIVAVSDLSRGQLWALLYGKKKPDGTRVPSKRIHRDTEARILAVELDLAGGARVASVGTVRRLRALVALGWSQSKLGRRLGILPSNFGPLVHGHRDAVTVTTDQAVRALYADLSMQLPPAEEWRDKIAASRSRSYAKAHGWLPPLAWDDDALDDPAATPLTGVEPDGDDLDEAAIDRRMNGDKTVRLTRAERVEVVRRLHTAGWALNAIERHTGLNPNRYRTATTTTGAA